MLDELSEELSAGCEGSSPPTLPTSVMSGASVLSGEAVLSALEPPTDAELLCVISPRISSPPLHPVSIRAAAKISAAYLIYTRFTAYFFFFLKSLENSSAFPRSPSTLSFPVVYARTGSSFPSISFKKLDGSMVIAQERSLYS